ncbi:MAG: hypothetical protein KME04_18310 [Pleurocapsa minor GSE-CHR-MK-17-07R]|jgi:O-antigen/teichoic acid export membrane protein|nr:hypothetical protein [Pleurocapsa minor GSE-CHR-MK 17-07R]
MSLSKILSSPLLLHVARLPFQVKQHIQLNRTLFLNASSLVATTAVTSVLGFAYWWLAARLYPPEAVGFASAAISAMMLLGAMGMLGLGTVLIGEVSRQPNHAGSIIVMSALIVGGASSALGILFALAVPTLSPELALVSQDLGSIVVFAVGVAFTAVTFILDQAFVGLLRGGLQLWRNIIFAAAKLILLYVIAYHLSQTTGLSIYAAWMFGNILSLVILAAYMLWRRIRIVYRPQFGLIRRIGRTALAHHTTNLILQAPNLLLPIAVTTLLSASANASFYAAWMIASFLFVIPGHLTTVLYAVGSKEPAALIARTRMTLRLSLAITLPMAAILFIMANVLLGLFGAHYAEQADWCLRILSLGVFPLIVKYHYIAFLRVYNRVDSAIAILLLSGICEIGLSAFGLITGGLTGLAIGWVTAACLEAIVMWFKLSEMMRANDINMDHELANVQTGAV